MGIVFRYADPDDATRADEMSFEDFCDALLDVARERAALITDAGAAPPLHVAMRQLLATLSAGSAPAEALAAVRPTLRTPVALAALEVVEPPRTLLQRVGTGLASGLTRALSGKAPKQGIPGKSPQPPSPGSPIRSGTPQGLLQGSPGTPKRASSIASSPGGGLVSDDLPVRALSRIGSGLASLGRAITPRRRPRQGSSSSPSSPLRFRLPRWGSHMGLQQARVAPDG